MNKYFRCNGLTKEQAIQAARDVAEREGLKFRDSILRSIRSSYDGSDIIIYNSKMMTHASVTSINDTLHEVSHLKPLTIDEADELVRKFNYEYEIDSDGDLWHGSGHIGIEQLEQILQIMRRIEK